MRDRRRMHAGSLEALRVTRPEAVDLEKIKFSGSAAATAIAAGVAAIAVQRHPRLSPEGLRRYLLASCERLQAPADRQGNGLIQVREVP
jgi:hypothetical protein